jgi:hypothetical protein
MNILGEAAKPVVIVLSWLPYVAAVKLSENVPSELDGLRAIVDSFP